MPQPQDEAPERASDADPVSPVGAPPVGPPPVVPPPVVPPPVVPPPVVGGAPAPTTGAPAPPAGMEGSLGPLFTLVRDQRVAFLLVGAFNTLIGTAWFVVFELSVGQRYGYMVSLLCAHVAAVLTAFVLYRRLVFRVRGHVWLDLFRFELVNLTSLGVNALALPFTVEVLGLVPIVAQLLVTLVTATISYFGHRGFSFHRKRPA